MVLYSTGSIIQRAPLSVTYLYLQVHSSVEELAPIIYVYMCVCTGYIYIGGLIHSHQAEVNRVELRGMSAAVLVTRKCIIIYIIYVLVL